jgi:hypothetical protein
LKKEKNRKNLDTEKTEIRTRQVKNKTKQSQTRIILQIRNIFLQKLDEKNEKKFSSDGGVTGENAAVQLIRPSQPSA